MSNQPISTAPPISPTDEKKVDVVHNDTLLLNNDLDPKDGAGLQQAQLKSTWDNLTIFQATKLFKRNVIICGISGFAALTDGYQHKLSANIIANKGFIAQFRPAGQTKLDPTHVSTFGGVYSAGQVVGQFSIQWVAEYLGRRAALWTFMLLLTIAAIVEVTSTVWWHWTIAKLIAGIGIGACQASLPLYINEHAPSQIRGFLIVAYSMWFSFGQLMASLTLKLRADSHPNDWKTPIYTQFGMIGLGAIIFILLPESPWWLVARGKMDKARKVLTFTYKGVPGYEVDRELGILEATVEQQKEQRIANNQVGFLEIFRGLNRKRFLIASWPKVLQQFVGLSIFSSYSAYFFQVAGNSDPFQVTVILGVLSVVAVFFDAILVDRIGRRLMTLIGFGGACFGVTLMAIVGCFDYASPQLGAVLVFAGVTAQFFNSFQSSTSYAYLTEIPEQRLKAKTIGWGLAYCNLYAIPLNFIVPILLDKLQVKAAFIFVGLGVPGTVLAYFIMPESSNRSPAEIQELFVDKVNLRKWKGYKTDVERDMEARMALNGETRA